MFVLVAVSKVLSEGREAGSRERTWQTRITILEKYFILAGNILLFKLSFCSRHFKKCPLEGKNIVLQREMRYKSLILLNCVGRKLISVLSMMDSCLLSMLKWEYQYGTVIHQKYQEYSKLLRIYRKKTENKSSKKVKANFVRKFSLELQVLVIPGGFTLEGFEKKYWFYLNVWNPLELFLKGEWYLFSWME